MADATNAVAERLVYYAKREDDTRQYLLSLRKVLGELLPEHRTLVSLYKLEQLYGIKSQHKELGD